MEQASRVRIPLSTLCLLVAVVALGLALGMITVRQNAQIREMTALHNAQILEQTERFNAQLQEQTARHNAQLAELAAAWRAQSPVPAPVDEAAGPSSPRREP